jgi:peptidoglycan/xylan/chitin deacetylase (PgdA/CDA1 family)
MWWSAATTPILMYHAFGAPSEPPSRYVVPVRRFARQMAWLARLRYRVVSLDEFLGPQSDHRRAPARSVVITIDDGYADNRTLAYPVLQRYGFPATIFVVTGSVGAVNDWSSGDALAGRRLMSWTDMREMQRAGVRFGAHTRTHPKLSTLPPEAARREIHDSRLELERELGTPIRVVSYPYGDYDATTVSIAAQAGFLGGCTTRPGRNAPGTPVHELRRTEISGTDTLVQFALKLQTGRNHVFARRRKRGVRAASGT